jgi:maleylpyruvate isomerase
MPTPDADIAEIAAAQVRVRATLAGLTDEIARRPSLLPTWTIGHVVTHLARNADSVTRRLTAAAEGRLVPQYEGGREGRAHEIEDGAARPAAELLDDMNTADAGLESCLAAMPADVWQRTVLNVAGDEMPAPRILFQRWREVETHHVDLGLGYGVADWPDGMVERWLPMLLERLPRRADPKALAGWLLNRGPAPELASWE